MSAETENQPVPNWLLKLEEQRERRLKVKLGHEADAGAKCQKCEDKCPGLDLHFWRKICKVCKCSKEDHDILDDDIYGYVQFQLLGSKPVKSKGAFLKGHKDEVILEWTPKGSSNDVKKYLDELPPEMVPVKGSEGAKIRKQRLQKQMPAHDIDSSLCHQLSEGEIKEMEEYVAHIRKNCVGQGKIIRLSLLKGSPHKINPSSPQFLSQAPSVQIVSSQTVFLQPSDLSNNLNNLSLREQSSDSLVKPPKAVLPTYTPQTVNPSVDNQSPSYYSGPQNIVHPLTTSNVERHQEQFEIQNANFDKILNYAPNYLNPDSTNPLKQYNPNYINPTNEAQIPVQVGQPKDLNYPTNINTSKQYIPNVDNLTHPAQGGQPTNLKNPNYINPVDQTQIPVQVGQPKDLNYPTNINTSKQYNPVDNLTGQVGQPTNLKNPNYINPVDQTQIPVQVGQPKDLNYPTNINTSKQYNPVDNLTGQVGQPINLKNPNYINPTNEAQIPVQVGQPKDLIYPANINNPVDNLTRPAQVGQPIDLKHPIEAQIPVQVGQPKDINYPTNINNPSKQYNPVENLAIHGQVGQPNNHPELPSDFKNKPQIPILEAQSAINPLETHQNLQSVGFLRDIDYPMGSLPQKVPTDPLKFPTDQNSNQQVKCHNCSGGFEDGDVAITADRTTDLWHAKCFNCATCKQPLADLLYFYHKDTNNIYCGRDYSILKGIPRCLACDELIFVREYCLAEDNTFHIKHFCCFECDEPLAGSQYIMENNQPVCITCFESIKAEKCNDCLQTIRPDQEGVSLQNLHWHASPECFACKKCRKSLLGNKLLLRNKNLFCCDICFKSY